MFWLLARGGDERNTPVRKLLMVLSLVTVSLTAADSWAGPKDRPERRRAVPELDSSAAVMALGLLAASVAVAHGRRRATR